MPQFEHKFIIEHMVTSTDMASMRSDSVYELSLEKDEDTANGDTGLAVQEEKPQLKRPSLYKVVMHNDDYTPMEFVVHVLESFFNMNRESATQTMLTVHKSGKAVCGIYSKDVAETKCAMVNQHSRDNEHPLLCDIEASDDEED